MFSMMHYLPASPANDSYTTVTNNPFLITTTKRKVEHIPRSHHAARSSGSIYCSHHATAISRSCSLPNRCVTQQAAMEAKTYYERTEMHGTTTITTCWHS
jgi:hypothetical protein